MSALFGPPVVQTEFVSTEKSYSACEYNLNFLRFTGDRNTRPFVVNWFLSEVQRYVRLGGPLAWGATPDDKLVNGVLSFLSQDPRAGKDQAY